MTTETIKALDMTSMHETILNALVHLRKNRPELSENQQKAIRDALWKAWGIAYDIEEYGINR